MRYLIFLIFINLKLNALEFKYPDKIEELVLLSEKPVNGMLYGNLSGITKCRGNYYVVSDKDDKNIYKLSINKNDILASSVKLPYFKTEFSILNYILSLLKLSSNLDLEAISCDNRGNLYLASEVYSQVLKIDNNNQATWLKFTDNLHYVKKRGLLVKRNGSLEGIAIDDEGKNLWLIAERSNRGIIKLTYKFGIWQCEKNCILINENTKVKYDLLKNYYINNDFSDAMWYKNKLFTLERALHRVCRRNTNSGIVEKCWSFANTDLYIDKFYLFYKYPMAEALLIDEDNTLLIGIDNNYLPRSDGQINPIILRFKPPKKGWLK